MEATASESTWREFTFDINLTYKRAAAVFYCKADGEDIYTRPAAPTLPNQRYPRRAFFSAGGNFSQSQRLFSKGAFFLSLGLSLWVKSRRARAGGFCRGVFIGGGFCGG